MLPEQRLDRRGAAAVTRWTQDRNRAASTASARLDRLTPLLLAALAAVVFLWRLDGSSWFVDEATSMNIVSGGISHLLSYVHSYETSPPTYFLLLSAWTHAIGSHSEVAGRLPSVLAAVALVVAIWYLARLLAGRTAALIAGLLAATSPLLLQYAQQARTYAPLMLFATLAAIAAVMASRRRSGRLLAVWCGLAVMTVSLHYIGWLVVAPMAIWLLRERWPAQRTKMLCVVALAAMGALWVPVALAQFSRFPNGGLGSAAALTPAHALQVLAAPFFGRAPLAYALCEPLGAAAVLGAAAWLLRTPRTPRVRELWLLVVLALAPIAALLALGLAGRDLVITRYATVAAPFLIVLLASAAAALPRRAAVVAASAAMIVLTVGGSVRSAQPASFYPDGRGVIAEVAAHWQPTDAIVYNQLGDPDNLLTPTAYYARRSLPKGFLTVLAPPFSTAQFKRLLAARRRLWIVSEIGAHGPRRGTIPPGYRVAQRTDFRALIGLRLILAVPA